MFASVDWLHRAANLRVLQRLEKAALGFPDDFEIATAAQLEHRLDFIVFRAVGRTLLNKPLTLVDPPQALVFVYVGCDMLLQGP